MADRPAPQTASRPADGEAVEAPAKRPVLPPMPEPKPAKRAKEASAEATPAAAPSPTAAPPSENGSRRARVLPPPPAEQDTAVRPPLTKRIQSMLGTGAEAPTDGAAAAPVAATPVAATPVAATPVAAAPAAAPVAPAPVAKPVVRAPVAMPATQAPAAKAPRRPAPARPVATSPQPTAVRRPTRRARLRLTRIDPWSVMKTAFLLSVAFGIVSFVAVMTVWTVLGAAGLWDSINSTVQGVLGTEGGDSFDVQDYLGTSRVLGFTTLVSIADVILLTALATLAAFLYNMAAALLGGIELTLTEDGD